MWGNGETELIWRKRGNGKYFEERRKRKIFGRKWETERICGKWENTVYLEEKVCDTFHIQFIVILAIYRYIFESTTFTDNSQKFIIQDL